LFIARLYRRRSPNFGIRLPETGGIGRISSLEFGGIGWISSPESGDICQIPANFGRNQLYWPDSSCIGRNLEITDEFYNVTGFWQTSLAELHKFLPDSD